MKKMKNFNNTESNLTLDGIYYGSRMFQFVADTASLPIDQVNFLIVQVFALLIAHVFRVVLHPNNVSSSTRHWMALSAGLCMSYFCFGKQVLLPIIFVVMCYSLLIFLPLTIFHHVTLFASILFLSLIHLHRLYNEGAHVAVDISAPLMIMVQKATSLAYSINDGLFKDSLRLTPLQKKFVIRSHPTALQYFSYLLCFQSILAGPFFMFTDYQDFIEGTQYMRYVALRKERRTKDREERTANNNRQSDNNNIKSGSSVCENNGHVTQSASGCTYVIPIEQEPNPTEAVLRKMLISFTCALLVIFILPVFPSKYLTDPAFLASSFLYKVTYILMMTTMARQLYYTAWFLADAVCSLSGLGFSGFDENGKSKWDLVSNVNLMGVEFGTSLKATLDSWNTGTMKWLRFLVYERAPAQKTLLTYLLSSIWHGFYPGYYLSFIGGAFFTITARVARRCIRPRILTLGTKVKRCYDFATFIVTRVCLSYFTFPFVLLQFWSSFYVYSSLKFYFHSMGFLAIILLPATLPGLQRSEQRKTDVNGKFDITNQNDHTGIAAVQKPKMT